MFGYTDHAMRTLTLLLLILVSLPMAAQQRKRVAVLDFEYATVRSNAAAIFGTVNAVMGLRVSEEEEIEGLDYGEHGAHAYDLGVGGGALDSLGQNTSPRPVAATRLASENG